MLIVADLPEEAHSRHTKSARIDEDNEQHPATVCNRNENARINARIEKSPDIWPHAKARIEKSGDRAINRWYERRSGDLSLV